MKIDLLPKTNLGKWSVRLIFAFFLLLFFGNVIVVVQGPRADQTFFSNAILSFPMLSAGAAGILAFFTGVIAIIKHKERSIMVVAATVIGFLVLIFVVGEILVPH